jgi:hypothetical protein
MTFDEWFSEHGSEVDAEWEHFCDEYGDLAPLLPDFRQRRYEEAVEEAQRQAKWAAFLEGEDDEKP